MSATGRCLTKRHSYDDYPTPTWCIEKIVREISWGNEPSILEPACGDGAIVNVLQEMVYPHVFQGDIKHGQDFLKMSQLPGTRYDFIITNPPFSLAQEFIECSLEIANCTIMLLRLNFLASSKRKEFWQKHPPTAIHILTKRPSFTGKGTDACDYAWFVWDSTCRQKVGWHWL